MSTPKSFSWKAFISFYIAFSFVVLGFSGVVLYVAPPGRVANWSVWTLIALSKAQWQAVHTIFSFVFLLAASLHLYFNWKVLVAYLKSKLHDGMRMKRELGAASTVAVILMTLTIAGAPPFSTVMDVGDEIKNAWTVPTNEPPMPHAEELTVAKLAETVKIPLDAALNNLAASGVRVSSAEMVVQQVADANGLTPQQLFQKMQSENARPQASMGGGGWGRKTVDDICRQYVVDLDSGVARLKAQGLDATGSTSLGYLALKAGKTPVDMAKVIVGADVDIAAPTAHQAGSK